MSLMVGKRLYLYVFLTLMYSFNGAYSNPLEFTESGQLPQPNNSVILEIRGDISHTNAENSALFDLDMLRALPVANMKTSTAVTDGIHEFEGFLMRDLLKLVGSKGAVISAVALNDYVIEFTPAEFERYDIVVAYQMDGQLLSPSDKGPLWIVYPRDQHAELQDIRYDYRWVWQLKRLDIQ